MATSLVYGEKEKEVDRETTSEMIYLFSSHFPKKKLLSTP